ncbi:MAG: hypothetical protein WD607_04370 [Candidatus Paceibacterota bacterium]
MTYLFSKYFREARLYPTILGLIPLYLLQYYYLQSFLSLEPFLVNIVGNVSFSVVILYFVGEFFVRYPGKLFEDKVFEKKMKFPTTNFILFGNEEYSKDFKEKIRQKIKKDFSLDLPNEKEEIKDEKEARLKIREAVGLIIKTVKDGHLVLKHNISYGFFRNLWSASILGLFFSIVLLCFSIGLSVGMFWFSVFLIIIYAGYLMLGKGVVVYFGENYARKLIEEYMNGNHE